MSPPFFPSYMGGLGVGQIPIALNVGGQFDSYASYGMSPYDLFDCDPYDIQLASIYHQAGMIDGIQLQMILGGGYQTGRRRRRKSRHCPVIDDSFSNYGMGGLVGLGGLGGLGAFGFGGLSSGRIAPSPLPVVAPSPLPIGWRI